MYHLIIATRIKLTVLLVEFDWHKFNINIYQYSPVGLHTDRIIIP